MTPAEEFLLEKRALNLGGIANGALGAGKAFGTAAGMAAATGAGAAAFMGAANLVGKAYSAATKARDFRAMMEANPDLLAHQREDPAGFNRMFTSLRTMAPDFMREPMVAGAYMRQGMEAPIEGRGGVAVQAMNARKPQPLGPLTDAAMQGYMKGLGSKKEERPAGQRKIIYEPGAGDRVVERIEDTQHLIG